MGCWVRTAHSIDRGVIQSLEFSELPPISLRKEKGSGGVSKFIETMGETLGTFDL